MYVGTRTSVQGYSIYICLHLQYAINVLFAVHWLHHEYNFGVWDVHAQL